MTKSKKIKTMSSRLQKIWNYNEERKENFDLWNTGLGTTKESSNKRRQPSNKKEKWRKPAQFYKVKEERILEKIRRAVKEKKED